MLDGSKFDRSFNPEGLVVLVPGDEPVVAYRNEFRGVNYFHIRKLWKSKYGTWMPGKGISVNNDQAATLIKNMGAL